MKGVASGASVYALYRRGRLRQNKAAEILSTAQKHFTREEFKELEDYVFERLEK